MVIQILKYRSIILALLALAAASCAKKAGVDVPPSERMPAVTCVISPESPRIVAKASWSDPLFSTTSQDGEIITNAVVTVSDGVVAKTLVYSSLSQSYLSDTVGMPIKPGVTYFLTFSADGKTATAKTTVPNGKMNAANSENYTITYSDSTASSWHMLVQSDIKVPVVSGEEYYSCQLFSLNTAQPASNDTIEFSEWVTSFATAGPATELQFGTYYETYYYSGGYKAIGLIHLVMVLNKDYYNYCTTALNSGYTSPFTEPVNVPSNIEGGFGFFGAYRALEVKKYFQ